MVAVSLVTLLLSRAFLLLVPFLKSASIVNGSGFQKRTKREVHIKRMQIWNCRTKSLYLQRQRVV